MRFAVLRIYPGPDGFHPADQAITDAADIERVAIREFNQLTDGTVVLLYALRGDPERPRQILSDQPDVKQFSVSQTGQDVHAYIQLEPTDSVAEILKIPQQYRFIVNTPIECLRDGSVRVTAIGDPETFTDALDHLTDEVEVELESMQEYEPEEQELYSKLTARQQEILQAAIDEGYYDSPRAATYEDVAETLDLSPVTVGEHLRKIEARVLTEVGPGHRGE